MAKNKKMQAVVEIAGVVGASLGKAMQQANRKLGTGNKAVAALGKTAGKAALAAGAAAVSAATVAAGAVANITKQSIQQYAEYEQLVGGVETLFKSSADSVKKYALQAYETAGLSANEYMNVATSFSASLLQSLGGNTAIAAEYTDRAIRDMADNANKMGTDMESLQQAYQSLARGNFGMLDNLNKMGALAA